MRRPLIMVVALALIGPPAHGDGSPGNTEIPSYIPVVGTQRGVPHPGHDVLAVIRDFTNNPVPGADVLFDFTGCMDVKLCSASVGGGTVDCANGWVALTADSWGYVRFTAIGGGTNTGNSPGHASGCVKMWVDGELVSGASGIPAIVLDQNGALPGGNGLTGADLSLLMGDVFMRTYVSRSDLSAISSDGGGTLTGLDVSVGIGYLLLSQAGKGSASGCHDGSSQQPYCP